MRNFGFVGNVVRLSLLSCCSCTAFDRLEDEENVAISEAAIVNGIPQSDSISGNRPVVQLVRVDGGREVSKGSGVLLGANAVLASAHQVISLVGHPEWLRIKRGNDGSPYEMVADVADILVHPLYIPAEMRDGRRTEQKGIDLSLVFLKHSLWPSISGNISQFSSSFPQTVRCESHYYHGSELPRGTQNYSFFPVIGGDSLRPGYFRTNVNGPYLQHLDRGDSGSPCFDDVGDSLVGIVSARPDAADFVGRTGIVVDARAQRHWILGASTFGTDAAVAFDWDLDGTTDIVRVTRSASELALEMHASSNNSDLRIPIPIATLPRDVLAMGLGVFNGAERAVVLAADDSLLEVNLTSKAQRTIGGRYHQLVSVPLHSPGYFDIVASTENGTADLYRGTPSGLSFQPNASVKWMKLDKDSINDGVTLNGSSLRVASSSTGLYPTISIPFTNPMRPQMVTGQFRRFTSNIYQGIEDLVAAEGGEVVFCKASLSAGFNECVWLHRPTLNSGVKVVEVSSADVNHDGYDELVANLSNGASKLYWGGTSSGLAETQFDVVALVPSDITKDLCVDYDDWAIFEESFGFAVGAGADARADFNVDGWVDALDYLIFAEYWQNGMGCI